MSCVTAGANKYTWPFTGPVSYTHLDVYKRQVSGQLAIICETPINIHVQYYVMFSAFSAMCYRLAHNVL